MPSSYAYSSSGKYGTSSKYGISPSLSRYDYDDVDSAYGSSSKTSSLYGGSKSDYKSSNYKSKYDATTIGAYDDEPISSSTKRFYGTADRRSNYVGTTHYTPVEDTDYDDSRSSHRAAIARGISPPRSDAERPRRQYSYSEHRGVSPLGSSRFEKPMDYSSRPLGRSSTVRETPTYGDDGYYGKSDSTSSYKGAGLSRSNAIRGRGLSSTNTRGFGSSTGYSSSSRYGSSTKNYGTDYDLY